MIKSADTPDRTASGLDAGFDLSPLWEAGPSWGLASDAPTSMPAAGDSEAQRRAGSGLTETPAGDGFRPARVSGIAGAATWIRAAVEALVAGVRRKRLAHRGYRDLMVMSDHDLADIGVSRGAIESVTRLGRPAFGRVPRGGEEAALRPLVDPAGCF